MPKFNLPSGGTVEFTRTTSGYDVHLRDADGATRATLDMSAAEALDLMEAASVE